MASPLLEIAGLTVRSRPTAARSPQPRRLSSWLPRARRSRSWENPAPGFLLQRPGGTIPVLLCVSLFAFGFVRLLPGNPVQLLAGPDATLGGLNGRQVADAARGRWASLPVLFITGYAGGALEGRLAPGMAMIGKPFALDALAEHIGAVLGNGR